MERRLFLRLRVRRVSQSYTHKPDAQAKVAHCFLKSIVLSCPTVTNHRFPTHVSWRIPPGRDRSHASFDIYTISQFAPSCRQAERACYIRRFPMRQKLLIGAALALVIATQALAQAPTQAGKKDEATDIIGTIERLDPR